MLGLQAWEAVSQDTERTALRNFPVGSVVNHLLARQVDLGSVSGLGRSPGEVNGKD